MATLADVIRSIYARLRAYLGTGASQSSSASPLTESQSSDQAQFAQALAFHQQGQLDQAQAIYQALLLKHPKHFELLHRLGMVQGQRGHFAAAATYIEQAIAIDPKHAAAHSTLGNCLKGLGEYEKALASYDRALARHPNDADTWSNRGATLRDLKRPEQALESFDQALAINPNHVLALDNRGTILRELKRPEEALASHEKALTINPDYALAHYNRGLALANLKQLEEACASHERALALNPDNIDALTSLGAALHNLKRHEDALACYEKALALNPDNSDTLKNRGVVLFVLRRFADALASYDRTIRIRPDDADTHMNLSLCLLRLGDFARGWEEFEWRWQVPKYREMRMNICAPIWEGQKLGGSLLVWNEQGLGDEIFYASMLNDLAPYAQSITVCVDPRLVPLFQRSFGNMRVISTQMLTSDAHFDAHIPIGSLGRYLRRSLSAFPEVAKPYLFACPTRAQNLRANIAQEKRLICGLSWISKSPAVGMDKSLRLHDLEPVLSLPGIDFVNLQYGDTDQEQAALYDATGLTLRRITEIDNFNDIDGLAALIEACDVVVTVSNTTAHLAAALGKSVLLMLPFSQGLLWYWHMERADNLWYPTVTSFRQPAVDDWRNVIETIRKELAQRRKDHCDITKVPAE